MPQRSNYRYIAPADADAEKACRLTGETVALRREPPEQFFAMAKAQSVLANGFELRFGDTPGVGGRIDAFIAEERECCPFFAFELWDEAGEKVLRILRLEEEAE